MECQFVEIDGQGRVPYVKELLSYNIGEFEGIVEFNGYFYVDDEDLPIQAELYISKFDKPDGTNCMYNVVLFHKIEIHLKKIIEDTSKVDSDGICLFPTCKQKVYFRVLHE
jgi:hypothetical protein